MQSCPCLHYFAQGLLARLLDVHGSAFFGLYNIELHNQDADYDILSGIFYGDSSFAISFDSLNGIPDIFYLCGIPPSPTCFYEPVGILYENNTSGYLNEGYIGICARNVGR